MASTRAGVHASPSHPQPQPVLPSPTPVSGSGSARLVGLPVGPIAVSLYRLALAAQSGELTPVTAATGWSAWTWKGPDRTGGRIELRTEQHPYFDAGTDGRARAAFDRLTSPLSGSEIAAVLTMAVSQDGRPGAWHGVDVVRLLRPAGDHRDRYCPIVENWILMLSNARFRFDSITHHHIHRRKEKARGTATVTVLGFERHNAKSATVSIPAGIREHLAVRPIPLTAFALNRNDGTNSEGAKLSRAARCQSRIGAVVQAAGGIASATVEDLLATWAPTACQRARRARRFGAALAAFTADIAGLLGVGTGVEDDRTGSIRTRPVRLIADLATRAQELLNELRKSPPGLLNAALAPPG